MKAIVNLRVEIVEGEDKGYILEETNRLIDLQETERPSDIIKPYKLCVEFVTPDMFRRRCLEEEN